LSGYSRPCNVLKANERPGSVPGAWHRLVRLFASIDLASHLVPGTDLAACFPHLVPGTDLAACLLATVLASHLMPGTDLAVPVFASIDLAPTCPPVPPFQG
jgi:hypothetical protein